MDLPWGSEATKQFVTNVGLITSNGPYGHNIMAAEWTHHVSYEPGLIEVCIRPTAATNANISKTKEFGVNLAAFDQNVLASISGGSTGKNINKIAVLKELGFRFFDAKKINILMVEGVALSVECKLVKKLNFGSHTIFIGEAVEVYPVSEKMPLVYHGLKFWKLNETIPKPPQTDLDKIQKVVEKHTRGL